MIESAPSIAPVAHRRALVVGHLGLVGDYLVRALKDAGWETVGVARNAEQTSDPSHRQLKLDLTDRNACLHTLAPLASQITHVFFAARYDHPDPAEESRINLAMLVNVLDGLESSNNCPFPEGKGLGMGRLQHVCLVHGTKWYGSHLGPYPTPAREDDSRCLSPVFYYAQRDEVARRQQGQSWSFSTVRPHIIFGVGTRYPHNCVTTLGAYGALCQAMGVPFSFPGSVAAYESISQATDADLLAQAMIWSATHPIAANQDYNVINGDYFRWSRLWPRLAEFFALPLGPVRPLSLNRELASADGLWDDIVVRHGLRPTKLAQLANWRFADFLFAATWDDMSSTVKLRQHGFQPTIATEDSLIKHLARMREMRLIP